MAYTSSFLPSYRPEKITNWGQSLFIHGCVADGEWSAGRSVGRLAGSGCWLLAAGCLVDSQWSGVVRLAAPEWMKPRDKNFNCDHFVQIMIMIMAGNAYDNDNANNNSNDGTTTNHERAGRDGTGTGRGRGRRWFTSVPESCWRRGGVGRLIRRTPDRPAVSLPPIIHRSFRHSISYSFVPLLP